MSSPQPKIHSALTADEAREGIILDFTSALRAKLIAAGLEGQHTTFVNAEWVGGVRVKAFLRKPVDVKAVGSLGGAGESDSTVEVAASVQREIENPEVVREELRTAEAAKDYSPAAGLAESCDADGGGTPASEIVQGETQRTEANSAEDSFNITVDPPTSFDTSSLCQFCSKPVSDNPNGLRSHMRIHVREGVAVEFTNGDGARAWRPA